MSSQSPSLDVTDERFDPLRALYSNAVVLPFPKMKPFDNLAQYAASGLLMTDGEEALEKRRAQQERAEKRVRADEERALEAEARRIAAEEKLAREAQKAKESTEQQREEGRATGGGRKRKRDVLMRMEECEHDKGPLSVIYRCFKTRCRTRVCIRRARGIRGVLEGYLVAFDKHLNLVLLDVDEHYRDLGADPSLAPKTRHINQLFLRGDNVVYVNAID